MPHLLTHPIALLKLCCTFGQCFIYRQYTCAALHLPWCQQLTLCNMFYPYLHDTHAIVLELIKGEALIIYCSHDRPPSTHENACLLTKENPHFASSFWNALSPQMFEGSSSLGQLNYDITLLCYWKHFDLKMNTIQQSMFCNSFIPSPDYLLNKFLFS